MSSIYFYFQKIRFLYKEFKLKITPASKEELIALAICLFFYTFYNLFFIGIIPFPLWLINVYFKFCFIMLLVLRTIQNHNELLILIRKKNTECFDLLSYAMLFVLLGRNFFTAIGSVIGLIGIEVLCYKYLQVKEEISSLNKYIIEQEKTIAELKDILLKKKDTS